MDGLEELQNSSDWKDFVSRWRVGTRVNHEVHIHIEDVLADWRREEFVFGLIQLLKEAIDFRPHSAAICLSFSRDEEDLRLAPPKSLEEILKSAEGAQLRAIPKEWVHYTHSSIIETYQVDITNISGVSDSGVSLARFSSARWDDVGGQWFSSTVALYLY